MTHTFCFSVQAEALPSSLSRVLDVFSLYGNVPDHCYSQLAGWAHEELVVDVQMSGLDLDTAERIARRLQRLVSVTSVLWSEKRSAAAA